MTWISSSSEDEEESLDWRLRTVRAGRNLAAAGKSSSVVSPSSAIANHVSIIGETFSAKAPTLISTGAARAFALITAIHVKLFFNCLGFITSKVPI